MEEVTDLLLACNKIDIRINVCVQERSLFYFERKDKKYVVIGTKTKNEFAFSVLGRRVFGMIVKIIGNSLRSIPYLSYALHIPGNAYTTTLAAVPVQTARVRCEIDIKSPARLAVVVLLLWTDHFCILIPAFSRRGFRELFASCSIMKM